MTKISPRLVRVSRKYLKIVGAFHMFKFPWEDEPCGGSLAVEDSGRSGHWRYEVFCTKCHECDPNGHGTRAAVLWSAENYFQ